MYNFLGLIIQCKKKKKINETNLKVKKPCRSSYQPQIYDEKRKEPNNINISIRASFTIRDHRKLRRLTKNTQNPQFSVSNTPVSDRNHSRTCVNRKLGYFQHLTISIINYDTTFQLWLVLKVEGGEVGRLPGILFGQTYSTCDHSRSFVLASRCFFVFTRLFSSFLWLNK